jgi:hypothetical protein
MLDTRSACTKRPRPSGAVPLVTSKRKRHNISWLAVFLLERFGSEFCPRSDCRVVHLAQMMLCSRHGGNRRSR